MAISRDSRKYIEGGNFDALEDQWLTGLTEEPLDLDYFTGVARALGGTGEEDRARALLEMLDEQLVGQEAWEQRLRVLERTGPLLFPGGNLHDEILRSMRAVYSDRPSLEGLLEWTGLHKAVDDIPKTWEKTKRFSSLISLDVGSVVLMKDKGAGRVTQFNFVLSKIKIDFERHPGLAVGFSAAAKVLEPIPAEHFLRRKLEHPDEIEKLAREDSGEFLRLLLEGKDKEIPAAEIRDALHGLLEEKEWSSWWNSARTHPQLVVSGKGARQTYGWAASTEAAADAQLDRFRAASLVQKLEIFRREAKRSTELKTAMAAELAREGAERAISNPPEALSIFWTLEKLGVAPKDVDWQPAELVRSADNPDRWLDALADRAQRLAALKEMRKVRDDWHDLWLRRLSKETDPKLLAEMVSTLSNDDPALVESFVDDVMAKPQNHADAFVWLLEIEGDSPLDGKNPLRLLQHALRALGQRQFASLKTRLQTWIGESAAISAILSRLDQEQAAQAEETLKRAPLENYVRTRLITALHLRHPELRVEEDESIYATAESIAQRRIDLKKLKEVEIPSNRNAIEEARALGDLKENFEYKSARQRHEYLSARLSKLEGELANVRPINLDGIDASEVRVGAAMTLQGDDGATLELSILGPWESDPENGVISYQAESAQNLLGKKKGDTIQFEGRSWVIEALESCKL